MKFSLLSLLVITNAAAVTDTVAMLCDKTEDALSLTVDSTNIHDTSVASG